MRLPVTVAVPFETVSTYNVTKLELFLEILIRCQLPSLNPAVELVIVELAKDTLISPAVVVFTCKPIPKSVDVENTLV